jgi:hypothetical protein
MNSQIEKLALECGAWHQVYESKRFMHDHNFDIEKFAELIVQECIHALWTEECRINAMTQADYERSGNRIHKHFYGVEE